MEPIDLTDDSLRLIIELQKTLPPEFKHNLTQAILGNLPAKQCMPYYKEEFAMKLKPVLDEMLERQGENRVFNYSAFPLITPHTLYLRVCQSWLWLARHHKDRETYTRLRNQCEVKRRDDGVVIFRRSNDDMDQNLKDVMQATTETAFKGQRGWKMDVETFLESGEAGTKLKLDNLSLSADDVMLLETQLTGLANIRAIIRHDRIVVMKLTEEQMADLTKAQNTGL
jgi:hypothetical protein